MIKNFVDTSKVGVRLPRMVAVHLNLAADSMVTLRKELAPKDTGWMAQRTRVVKRATPDNLQVAVLCDSSNNPQRGGNNAAYDEEVEFGTVNSDAQPSAIPAFESAKRQLNRVRGIF